MNDYNNIIKPQIIFGILIIVIVTYLAYIPAIQGGFIWDDDDYVTENETLRSLEGLRQIWFEIGAVPQYYPMVHTTFWIEFHLWGLNPMGYHIVNVFFHVMNSLLLWWLLSRLSIPGAWFGALIFAIHPVHVESVAWITERKNVLSGFFYFCSVLLYLKFLTMKIQTDDRGLGRKRKKKYKRKLNPGIKFYILSLLFFVFALLSKTVTLTMPVAVLLVLWWKYKRINKQNFILLIPFFIIGGGLSLITIWMEKNIVGASGGEWTLTFIERCLVAGRVVWFYFSKLLLPLNLTFNYPRWQIDQVALWQYFFPLSLIIIIVFFWRFSPKTGKGPVAAIIFFIITLGPALGFIDVFPMRYSYVADHFQYLASLGIIVLIISGTAGLLKKRKQIYQITGIVLFTGIVFIFSAIVWRQGHVYKDLETLWRHTLLKNPQSWMAHTHLGSILYEREEYEDAIEHQKRCIIINPDYDASYNSLGRVYHKLGRNDEAIKEYMNALKVNPEYYRAYNNIGVIFEEQGKYEKAVEEYKKAIRLKPGYDVGHCNLGNTFLKMDLYLKALQAYRNALDINPVNENAQINIKLVYKMAIEHYKSIIKLDPNNVNIRYELGLVHAIRGNLQKAIGEWYEVLRIDSEHKNARNSIARARRIIGRPL
jgi:tetratricopeptide (TPR) repeat protein